MQGRDGLEWPPLPESILALSVSHSLDRFPLLPLMRHLPPARGRWHEVPEGEQGVTVGDGEGEPAEKESIFRLFPENATFLQKKLQFFLEKGRFPIDSLVIIGM